MDFSIFAYVALLFFVALLSTRLMRVLKLPNVTGYIVTGIIMGPFVFGLLFNSFDNVKTGIIYGFINGHDGVGGINWVSTVALGFIAFSIGTSFKRATIKALGKRVLVITILEALGASLLVIIALMVAHFVFQEQVSWQMVLVLSAIASATAPAATLMVIKQYNARGPLVNTLLPVVALDDAAALILFAILFQLASALSGGTISVYTILVKPLLEITISLGIGIILGLLISLMNGWFKSRNNRLIWCIFSVFAALGFYYLFRSNKMGNFELSSLLICMMAGAIYTNFVKDSNRTLDVMDRFTSPIYMMFFVISGASLDLSIFFNSDGLLVVGIAFIYIIFRVVGKWSGAFVGASITRCEPQVKKYLGFALVPQAGVAIGLSTTAYKLFLENGTPEAQKAGALILAIILTSTLVYELIGPMVAKFAFKRAHEIPEENL
ncbi:MAG: cation:proton antiporter [Bacilli bacterium]|nr:cation:proton antiporter [Bacilli bacterium]